jgi:hypothetical protein
MAQHIDQEVVTQTGLAAGASFSITVNTDTADRIAIFVDDGAGNAPASYDYEIEVSYNEGANPTYMPRSSVTGSTSTQHQFTGVAPFYWRITFTNSSGASNDYRARVIVQEDD